MRKCHFATVIFKRLKVQWNQELVSMERNTDARAALLGCKCLGEHSSSNENYVSRICGLSIQCYMAWRPFPSDWKDTWARGQPLGRALKTALEGRVNPCDNSSVNEDLTRGLLVCTVRGVYISKDIEVAQHSIFPWEGR